ncbi:polysaccharide deacetylase family protein [Paenibacillus sediminis]|uniref:Glycoside hydrolase/deacetylase ChbG (UPF0249 family) n=1 Tax=Paenibacillus sediminis TaxID=664909 RepID=A0ABS4H4K4_9BACL|nr:polysaccharide deacetylase family protein [Paenibacillus sediminis]MBP1937469.1 putative glycoside hydrolase/deacetylase ChbG (UPF0249 family) [Paenibacillus sediminis]
MSLSQRLGYSSADRLLIINGDDYGMCHANNRAIQGLLSEGIISSATVMMPCTWAKEAVTWAASHPQYDVGVHLTFTSEWESYKWGPVTRNGEVSSLITEEGYFPQDSKTFELSADEEEVRAEIIHQIELAIQMGLNPTHLDNHMGSLYGLATGRDFLEIVFDICASYGLPFRMPRNIDIGIDVPSEMAEIAKLRAQQADEKGVIILDYLLGLPFQEVEGETYETFRYSMASLLHSLKPGVSEIILHPSVVTDELQAINPHFKKRGMEFELFRDPFIKQVIKEEGIHMIRWRDLRDLQREG